MKENKILGGYIMKKIFRNLFVSKNDELEARTKYEIGKIYLRASKMITVENEEDDRDQNWLLEKSTEYFAEACRLLKLRTLDELSEYYAEYGGI